jgi:chorismate-pyruvate lyase
MLRKISNLERRWGIKLGIAQKILLAEIGTVEQILSVLVGSKVSVEVTEQEEKTGIIGRKSYITTDSGKILVSARSRIFARNLPPKVVALIRARQMGIGTVIQTCNLETFRRITELGYNPRTKVLYRKYQIRHKNRVAFDIEEDINASKGPDQRRVRIGHSMNRAR